MKGVSALNATWEAMLSLLKTSLFGHALNVPADVEWDKVYHEMQNHRIASLAGNVLQEIENLDDTLGITWMSRIARNVQKFYQILDMQQQTMELLESHEINAVVLKGAAAAKYYPEPSYRAMGDIDLLLGNKDADSVRALMLANGFTEKDPEKVYRRHFAMMKDGIEYEMHRSFSTLKDAGKAKMLDDLLLAAMEEACVQDYDGYRYRMLPELQNGLVILEHVNHHLNTGIGLRQILDWVMYVDRVLDDEFWRLHFQPVARELGLAELAMTITRMGQMYIGLKTENRTWCMGADEQLCQDFLEYVLENGNFGLKHGAKNNAAKVMTDFRGVGGMFRSLQELGCVNFREEIRKYPFLKPFAWLLRIGRLISLGIRRKLSVGSVVSSYQESRRRIRLVEKLGASDRGDDEE